jgi:hypothetical protein
LPDRDKLGGQKKRAARQALAQVRPLFKQKGERKAKNGSNFVENQKSMQFITFSKKIDFYPPKTQKQAIFLFLALFLGLLAINRVKSHFSELRKFYSVYSY